MTPEQQADFDRIAAILPGYPAHCVWVVQTYGGCQHTPPEGTATVRLVAPDIRPAPSVWSARVPVLS